MADTAVGERAQPAAAEAAQQGCGFETGGPGPRHGQGSIGSKQRPLQEVEILANELGAGSRGVGNISSV